MAERELADERSLQEPDGAGPDPARPGFSAQIRLMLSKLSFWQKASLCAIAAAIVAGIIWMIAWTSRPEYSLLFADLAPEDAAAIVQQLKEQKVRYRISGNGTRIDVEKGRARDLRLAMVGQGLPSGGAGKGFELFDEMKLGTTGFVENLNYRRALEAELARTIVRFQEVSQARVHLVIPKPSLYWEKEKKPTASVWVKLRNGASLQRGQVRAIVHLVAGAVEGLKPQNITVVDSYGEILTDTQDQLPGGFSYAQLKVRREVEKSLENKIVSLLEPLVGPGHVRARVSVNMDFQEVKQQEEDYDPTGKVIRSEQEVLEESSQAPSTGGIPGTKSNLGQAKAQTVNTGTGYRKKQQVTKNYEVSKTVRTVIERPGKIKRISAAVVIDDKVVKKEEAGEVKYEHTPRSAAEVAKCSEIVKKAIGYDKDRGDTVIVENLSFDRSMAEESQTEAAAGQRQVFWSKIINALRTPLVAISIVLVFVLVIKPLMKTIIVREEQMGLAPALAAAGAPSEALPGAQHGAEAIEAKTVEQLEAEMLSEKGGEQGDKRQLLIRRITEILDRDRDKAMQLIKTLINERRA